MEEVTAQDSQAQTLAAQTVEMAAHLVETLVGQLVSWDPFWNTLVLVDNFQLEGAKSTDENQQMISAFIQILCQLKSIFTIFTCDVY